jgi:acyl-CoA synthetase (AMP-forming)/AMP-acid ligase II/NADP-dependent 3-hydroxy acid dehydrogenase YdfG/acyl carrier protein
MTATRVDDDLLRALTAAVLAVPGVSDAAAVARKEAADEGVQPEQAQRVAHSEPVRAEEPVRGEQPVRAESAVRGERLPAADLYGGEIDPVPDAPATLQEALRQAARLAPDKGTVYLVEGRDDVLQTYAELLDEAQRVLAGLRAAGLKPNDAALFVFADNRAYLTAFWACVLGGFLPTPVAVATTYTAPNEANRKLRGAWRLLDEPVVLTDADTVGALSGVRELWDEPSVRILTVEELAGHPPATDWFPATADTPVLHLLTSGSTGVPKCVRHTNASVVARSLAVAQHCGLTSADVSFMWMPFDHVTVAFYNVRDVILKCLHVNARTAHVLGDPLLWLDGIDRYRATNTWAPNFAFAMVNERASEIAERNWDLSCLREVVNAGEPVIAATSRRFLRLLAPHGLPADAMTPVWGMSETCSGVTYTRQHRDDDTAGTVAIDPASLTGAIRRLDPGDRGAVVLSRVGRPIPGVRARVVDDTGAVLPEGRLGELRVTGRTMMDGYFANPEANSEAYDQDGWFRTGDLAFVTDGELVIAGRAKDQIIVRGINYLAHELESVVERVDGVRVTFSAAVGIREPGASTDQLVIFFVPARWDPAVLDGIGDQVRAVLVRESGIAPDLVVPVTEAEFAKTANGKIQRAALADGLRAGRFADRVRTAEATSDAAADTAWLFAREWVELPDPPGHTDPAGVCVVFAAEGDVPRLSVSGAVVVVRGEAVRGEAPGRYRAPVTDRDELGLLLRTITERHGHVSAVVWALPLSLTGTPAERLRTGTAELTAIVAALAAGGLGDPALVVLTAGGRRVFPGDRVDLGVCALPALIRTAITETALPIRHLDLPGDPETWPEAVRADLADSGRTGLVAARSGRRWQPKLTRLGTDATTPPVVAGGLYLVTGGLGGIAHEITTYLAAAYGVRLLLIGRSEPTGEKAARLAELSALGPVDYHRADVADGRAIEAAVAAAEQRSGRPLAGVLHLAAADPTGQWDDAERHTIVAETAATYTAQYHAKVRGTLALAEVLESRPEASLVLFGSVNGEFGGHSFGAYATANSFLDGFAEHWHHDRGRRVQCLAWSVWSDTGMNQGRSTTAAEHGGFRPIDREHGLRLFLEAWARPEPHVIIGLDLTNPAIIEELAPRQTKVHEVVVAYAGDGADPGAVRAALTTAGCPAPLRVVAVPAIARGVTGAVDTVRLLRESAPGTGHRYAPPQTELEERLTGIWSEALGRARIGRDQPFFELGGNSLRAARLLALTGQRIGIRLSTQEFYEKPTVADMAAVIEKHLTGR